MATLRHSAMDKDAVIGVAPSLPANDSGCVAPSTMNHDLMGYSSNLWFPNGLFSSIIGECCHKQPQCNVAIVKETLRFPGVARFQEQAARARTIAFKFEPCVRLALGSRLCTTVKTRLLHKKECQIQQTALHFFGIIESSVNLDAECIVMRLSQSALARSVCPEENAG